MYFPNAPFYCYPAQQAQRMFPWFKGKASKKFKKAKFTSSEDELLRELVKPEGRNDWAEIATHFSNRNARQVKERWEYYLSPEVNNGPWTPEEDQILISKFNELGSKWTAISKFLPSRTNTCCKNRWLAMMRTTKERKRRHPKQTFKIEDNTLKSSPVCLNEFIPAKQTTKEPEPYEEAFDFFDDSDLMFQESSFLDSTTSSLW